MTNHTDKQRLATRRAAAKPIGAPLPRGRRLSETVRVGVVGPRGRMGAQVLALLGAGSAAGWQEPGTSRLILAATLGRAGSPAPSAPAGDVLHTHDATRFAAAVDVVVDFSAPAAAAALAPVLAAAEVAYLVASTALDAAATSALARAEGRCPVLVAANTSTGVEVLRTLVAQAARALPMAEVEILEAHHRAKRDAPSGTALALGQAIAHARPSLAEHAVLGRTPKSPGRQPGELGYSAVRGGDVVGEHTVYFFLDGERLELSHRCTNPQTFALGALRAARWLVTQAPGRYTMASLRPTA